MIVFIEYIICIDHIGKVIKISMIFTINANFQLYSNQMYFLYFICNKLVYNKPYYL